MNGFSNFPDCFVLACIITKEIFFPRHWYCFVKGHSPPNNAIFINVYLCIVAFFEQGNNAFHVKRFIKVQHCFSVATDKSTIVLWCAAEIQLFNIRQIRRGAVQPKRGGVYIDNQNIRRNGLAFDAQGRQVFNTLEKNGVQIGNVQLEFKQVSVDNPIVIVCKYFINI